MNHLMGIAIAGLDAVEKCTCEVREFTAPERLVICGLFEDDDEDCCLECGHAGRCHAIEQ